MQEKYKRKTAENNREQQKIRRKGVGKQQETAEKQEEIERNGERKKQLETLTPQA